MPRPYKALRRQGYRRDFTTLTGRENVGFCSPKALPWAEFCCPFGAKKNEAKVEVKSSRHRRDCRGEACLARRVRSTRITDVAITHSKTSFVGYCGRGVPRPIRHNVPNLSCRYVYKLLDTNSVGAKPDSPKSNRHNMPNIIASQYA